MAGKTKLELTWIGKDERPRLEPRILIEEPEFSYHAETRREGDNFDNMLIHGDNLLALKALETDPNVRGQVKCIYIDPPFNTQQAFENYDDGIEHSLWLSLMRERCIILHRLLSEDGSMFVHIDDNELGYIIPVLDEIFGRRNRISIITFKQSSVSGPKAGNKGVVTTNNYIIYYSKSRDKWSPGRVYTAIGRDDRYSKIIKNYDRPFSEWQLESLKDEFCREKGISSWSEAKKKFTDKIESKLEEFVLQSAVRVVRTARVAPKDVNEDAREALAESNAVPDRVFCSKREGKDPYYFINGEQLIFYSAKTKLIDGKATTAAPLTNLWEDLLSNNLHAEGGVSFPNGKKPEALIKRCLELATSEGDLVLDSFGGSGSTPAVAHKMKRRWIVVELGDQATTHIQPRLKRIVDGQDNTGITSAVSWKGGGGYRFLKLAPSLLQKDKWGNLVINKDYQPEMLGEAMCKHFNYTYAPSSENYWMHGKATDNAFIYVTTNSLTFDQLKALSEEVGEERSLLVCCMAYEAAGDSLTNLTIKKIPRVVLDRCEWGKDDYSLKIEALPLQEEEPDEAETTPNKSQKIKTSVAQTSLFDGPEEN
ncbi:site-specific DNA-methyltransferase [Pseudomonas spirodelae]|uniref:site-specific DNA-methyltransferase (adenine-specific) n=1 Tax=Pseudomonas spirodelae TaxID=3101751 RepID=A0ABU5PC20_9PSED|nr:site-specific DNA-methyltransferase [Pseudomonas sp. T5W1]MEA1607242.1 site-specific DNA-methyltransferase [Pseudomonas sp. T5W1]